jgi:ribosome-associated translation inhibitor RaiA
MIKLNICETNLKLTESVSNMTEEAAEKIKAIAETKPTVEVLVTKEGKTDEASAETNPKDSYVKLAMRNMVRKGRQSLWHFFLTTVGLVGLLVGLAYLTKP